MKRTPLLRKTRLRSVSEKKAAQVKRQQSSRSTGIRQRKKKAAAPKRTKEEFNRIYGSKERVEFVKALGCVVCTALHPLFGVATAGRCQNCHTENGGMGRKASYLTIVPMCSNHHRMYDQHQHPLDQAEIRAAIKEAAPDVERCWQAELSRRSA